MLTIRSLPLAVVASAVLMGAASCDRAPVKSSGGSAPVAPPPALWTEPRFTAMLQAYRSRIDRTRRVLRFEMNESEASLQVQDAAGALSAESFDYLGGELHGPSPVDLAGAFADPDLDGDVFDWYGVAMERIPLLVRAAEAQSKLAGAHVVKVEVSRRTTGSSALAARVEAMVDARRRAMEQKARRLEQNPTAGDDTKAGQDVAESGRAVAPTGDVQLTVLLRAPASLAWITADATGTITGSGVGPAAGVELALHGTEPRTPSIFVPPAPASGDSPRPYWRRAAGLKP